MIRNVCIEKYWSLVMPDMTKRKLPEIEAAEVRFFTLLLGFSVLLDHQRNYFRQRMTVTDMVAGIR